jgi:hypothetical protein
MNQKAYTEQLEAVIRGMLNPLKNLPFPLVIESLSGHKVERFDPADPDDQLLLDDLTRAALTAGKRMKRKGIQSRRANEVGNYIEPYVIEALQGLGFEADKPTTMSGRKKATGYPDIYFKDRRGRPNYLECKTHNSDDLNSGLHPTDHLRRIDVLPSDESQ